MVLPAAARGGVLVILMGAHCVHAWGLIVCMRVVRLKAKCCYCPPEGFPPVMYSGSA